MLKNIWECSSTSLTDAPDRHVVEALKVIDGHLSAALEEDGDWIDNLGAFDNDKSSEKSFYQSEWAVMDV